MKTVLSIVLLTVLAVMSSLFSYDKGAKDLEFWKTSAQYQRKQLNAEQIRANSWRDKAFRLERRSGMEYKPKIHTKEEMAEYWKTAL